MNRAIAFALTFSFLLQAAPAAGQEWTRFRGPNGSGVSTIDLPERWTDKDYNWKVPLPGKGHSSPVLWGDKIFVTAADKSGKRLVLCLAAADGRVLWQREFDAKTYRIHKRNSFATATPTVDEQRVYVAWATPSQYQVLALDHQGQTVWQTDLGTFPSQHGMGVSPILVDDLVIVGKDQDGDGSLIALDRKDGKIRWQMPRHGKNATYSTPCVYQAPGRPAELIFTNWQHGITGVDPKTGKANWELSVFEPKLQERAIASPVVAGDLVLGTCGFTTKQKHFVAVRPGDAQAGIKPKEVWRIERSVAYLPTPLVKGKLVFLCSELGIATCLDAATGKVIWQERLPGTYSASPVCAGARLYCVANDGSVVVLSATDRFALLAKNSLGEATQSTPAIAGGKIYFRTAAHLIALGGKKTSASP